MSWKASNIQMIMTPKLCYAQFCMHIVKCCEPDVLPDASGQSNRESEHRYFAQGFEQNFSYTLHKELWGIMAANHCHSWWRWWLYLVIDTGNSMPALILVLFVLVLLELTLWLLWKFVCGIFSATSSCFPVTKWMYSTLVVICAAKRLSSACRRARPLPSTKAFLCLRLRWLLVWWES
jgi:hypothetical protein